MQLTLWVLSRSPKARSSQRGLLFLYASSFTSDALSENPIPLFQRALSFRLPNGKKCSKPLKDIALEGLKSKIISDLGDSKCPYISSQASKFGNEPMAGVLRSKSDKDRWMWDIYGTGFPKPNEPVWMSDFVRETCTREDPVPAVYLPPSKYDEMKTYFKDLDRHMGITRERPSKISMWAWWGEVDVIRTEEP